MFCAGRDNQLSSLEAEVAKLLAGAKELRREMAHKEESVTQLKAQLEYQCLGRYLFLYP